MEIKRPGNIAKVVIIALDAIVPIFSPLPKNPDYLNAAPWQFLAIMVGVGIFTVFILDNAPKNNIWLVYNWYSLRNVGFFGVCLLVYGISTAIVGLTSAPKNWFFEMPLSLSIGIIATVMFLRANPPIDGSED